VIGPLVRLGVALAVRPHAVARRGLALAGAVLRTGPAAWPGAVHAAGAGLVDDARLGPPDAARLREVLDAVVPDEAPRVRVGVEVAATEGAVVLRTPAADLVQYLPRTARVHEVPLLVVPPPTHHPWLVDLGPGRSAVDHLVHHGVQVFALSWRAGGVADAAAARDALAGALAACGRVTRTDRCSLLVLDGAAALLPPAGDRVASVTVVAPAAPATGLVRAWTADRLPVPARLRAVLDAVPRDADHRVDHRVDDRTPWWAGWTARLVERSGGLRDAPPELGGRGLHPIAPTPAEVVRV
jgi:hypothetical protein